ncbi:bifunctional hydroxymethylpyrimidine kinase/phosphomethylpyrimidine kinase [Thiomicrorhabdus lithotrophica]|uniref:hydroxymethylpyrimidine kinase n=1 Tax=Thiomicrorhabdus lithotrophica TaxID=2949997 RepID=A0ABY8CFB8_9GAMM|nr:bifunctional hydroxymethylpyrimidine kinase/phosphomethylpyrimidine kinase [Thiomicrorhabdus lithotrophica]WEJ62808.1 bifunctional hydroxymethylpyrimidine kinase/phosphomethylpyrimidine kinase [Thiomicrorhabdus lithotrophica]
MTPKPLATVLSIAGSDCSSGAGIQADLKSIHANGGYALTVPTALTAQNSQGVQNVFAVPALQVKSQLESLISDYQIGAIKIGMLVNAKTIEVVINLLKNLPTVPVVLDPILVSSSGKTLLEKEVVNKLINELFPLVTLITPNLPELNKLLDLSTEEKYQGNQSETREILIKLQKKGWPNCLLKGGHSDEEQANDYLLLPKTGAIHTLSSARIQTQHNHGTGCTLSSAIATHLAARNDLLNATKLAKEYLFKTLKTAELGQPSYKIKLSDRHGGLNHFGDLINKQ